MLFDAWKKFRGWTVLEYFFSNRATHVKELARRLNISPGTAQYYLKLYAKEHILDSKRVGNLTLYELNDNFVTRALKRAYALAVFGDYFSKFINDNKDIVSLAVYGSYADGNYDEKSDLDIIVISQNKKLNLSAFVRLEADTKKEVKTETFSTGEWRTIAKSHDNFYNSVIKDNVLLYGARL